MAESGKSSSSGRMRVAFVVQRYGAEVNGGAEALCRLVAERMIRYWSVDVLTTCALDYVTWKDHYPAGVETLNGVTVRRFSVPRPRDIGEFDRLSRSIGSGSAAGIQDQEDWMRAQGPWSPALLEFIAGNRDRYDAFVYFGYLYAQTYFGLPLTAGKSILVPCAHDEWTIHMGLWERMFRLPSAFVFNTIEEKQFLEKRFPGIPMEGLVVGVATERPADIDPRRFRSSFELQEDFLLYAGRIDPSKGCAEMFDFFLEHAQRTGDARPLVTLGRAVMAIPRHPQIRALGFVSEQDKWDALAACDLLIMPSRFESLSMVLLEAWSVGKPVLANAACDVLRGQISRSNGGLAYRSRDEFSACLGLLSAGGVPSVLGRQGYEFVRSQYSWDRVEDGYRRAVENFGGTACADVERMIATTSIAQTSPLVDMPAERAPEILVHALDASARTAEPRKRRARVGRRLRAWTGSLIGDGKPSRGQLALWLGFLVPAIAAGWMAGTGRHSLADFTSPLHYSGDAIPVLAWIKAYAAGEIIPLLPKTIESLGAPFGANWTDFPAEDFLYAAAALFSSAFGLWTGSTLFVLGLHILAGLAFFAVGIALRFSAPVVFAGALLFALAPFGFTRSLPHLTVAAYWHVPLLLFAVKWAAGGTDPGDSFKAHRVLAAIGAVSAGLLNPYYFVAFMWLSAWVLVGATIAARRRDLLATGTVMGLAAFAYAIQSLDLLWLNLRYGSNPEAIVRHFSALNLYGLRLPDLVFPHVHRSPWLQTWADVLYQTVAPGGRGRGEALTSYVGLVAATGLVTLFVGGTIRVAARQFDRVSEWYWMALAITGFAVVGGINYLLGAFGFVLLRATNRLSIVLMAIALLWLCEAASAVRHRIVVLVLAAMAVAAGLWDQIPPPGAFPAPGAVRARVDADARFVRALESALPEGAMVLQLPIKKFPESGSLRQMEDYEHLRPFLHSRHLRFSYGTIKGRGDADWQDELAQLPAGDLVSRASQFGFAAIYINRKAYEDAARALESVLRRDLGPPLAVSDDLIAFRLPAAAGAGRPPLKPVVRYQGFSTTEQGGGHSWTWATQQEASIVVRRPFAASAAGSTGYEVSFGVESGNGGEVSVTLDGKAVAVIRPGPSGDRVSLSLESNRNKWRIELRSTRSPERPGNGDPRRIAFRTMDLQIRETGR